jgi:hypothetical protein
MLHDPTSGGAAEPRVYQGGFSGAEPDPVVIDVEAWRTRARAGAADRRVRKGVHGLRREKRVDPLASRTPDGQHARDHVIVWPPCLSFMRDGG